MVKMKYWIRFSDCTLVVKVRYYETKEEAERMSDELSELCNMLIRRGLILDYRINIRWR